MYFKRYCLFTIVTLLFLVVPVFLFSFTSQEVQKEEKPKYPQLELDIKSFDYDTIVQHSKTNRRIKVTNTGDLPLQIFNVRSSCGVSVPAWPRQPIEPGEESFIQIRYNSSNPGPINRKLIIHSNSPENTKIIKIEGYVVPGETI